MKKFLLVLAAFALISLPVIMTSCDEDNPVDCSTEYTEVIQQGNKTCLEYKSDLQDYLDKDCNFIYDSAVELIIDGLDC